RSVYREEGCAGGWHWPIGALGTVGSERGQEEGPVREVLALEGAARGTSCRPTLVGGFALLPLRGEQRVLACTSRTATTSPAGAAMVDSLSRRQVTRKPAIASEGGIVVSQSRLAAQAGAAVLAAGGNAGDAAVVSSLAVGGVGPWMRGLGGGGLLLHRGAASGRVRAWDFGMRSPAALDPADYPVEEGAADKDLFGWSAVKEGRNLRGGSAIAVPGQVAGLAAILEELGTDRKSTRLNSSHVKISYAVFCLKKKNEEDS